MKEYQIDSYRQEYMEEILHGWNQTLIFDPINETRFLQQVLLDENFDKDLAPVLLVQGKVVGFCLGIKRKYPYLTRGLEESRGWISIMFILPEMQGKGYGTILLEEMERRLKLQYTEEITLCAYSPNYFTPGVDLNYEKAIHFFDSHGYVRGDQAVSMQRDLFNYVVPVETEKKMMQLNKEGFSFCTFSSQYMEKLLMFAGDEFGGGWMKNILDAIRKGEAEDTILLALDEKKQVVGYCMRKIDGNDARFGPIGVKESLRSYGIGGVLFDLQMRSMQQRQIYYAYFLWTHGPAVRFYERHGMHIYRRYQLYRKPL